MDRLIVFLDHRNNLMSLISEVIVEEVAQICKLVRDELLLAQVAYYDQRSEFMATAGEWLVGGGGVPCERFISVSHCCIPCKPSKNIVLNKDQDRRT